RRSVAEEGFCLAHRHGEHLADVLAAELVLQHLGHEAFALAHLAHGGDPGHHREVHVRDAGAVAVGAGALGVRTEQPRLHAVGLRERLTDGLQEAGVCRGIAAPRTLDRRLIDRHDAFASRYRPVDERALTRASHAGDDHQYAQRDVDVYGLQVVRVRSSNLQITLGLPDG